MIKIAQTYKDSFSGLSKEVWQLAAMMLVNRIGTLILPFLTLYTTQDLHWTAVNGGIAASAFGFGGLAGSYLGGVMTDRWGYYKTMTFGLFSAAIIFFFTQYFTDFYYVCLALFFGSLAADTLRPALFSGLKYVTNKETQTRAISLMRMAFNLGIAIGPAAAGAFVIYTGYKSIFIIDAVTCLLAGVMLLLMIKNHESKADAGGSNEIITGKSVVSPYKDGPFLLFMLSNLLMLIAFFQIVGTVPLFIKEGLNFTEREVGLFFTANGLIIFLFEMPLIRYIEQKGYSHLKIMIYGAFMMGAGLLCLVLPNLFLLPLILYTLLVSFGEIINFPFISTTSMDRATDASRGKYMGLTSMMFSVALIIAPLLGTSIYDAYGFDTLWVVMFLVNSVGLVGYYYSRKSLEASAEIAL